MTLHTIISSAMATARTTAVAVTMACIILSSISSLRVMAFHHAASPNSFPPPARHKTPLLRTPHQEAPSSDPQQTRAGIIFPGGGLFFYWQAGVISHLRENSYDFRSALLSGASAGALSATLAETDVCPRAATELALELSEEAGVWERPSGLMGIWGHIIHCWLDRLLPADADRMVEDRLHILVTPVPSFGKRRVSSFESRQDLIHANMASVHLPWFLDGNWTYNFRGDAYIDGSFLAQTSDYFDKAYSDRPKLVLDFKRDPVMRARAADFVKVVSKQAIWDIFEQGKKHAKIMDKNGEFDILR